MGFDLAELRRAVAIHGRVARVVVARVAGSTPREVGAAMLVWAGGQSGSIGGGALEYALTARARAALPGGGAALTRHALGPDMGQCCGGVVWALCEVYDAARIAALSGGPSAPPWPDGQFPPESFPGKMKDGLFVRRVEGTAAMPLSVARLLDRARGRGETPAAQMLEGWMIEAVDAPRAPVWIWGAGHLGRALVAVLAPLPGLEITWVDSAAARFPDAVPEGVTVLPAARPEVLMAHAPRDAHHLILTYSHDLDLALCDAVLRRGFASAGVIGSATKWARFRRRLAALGHGDDAMARIACPIGDARLGKHPQAIAIGVAAQLSLLLVRQDSTGAVARA